MAIIKRDFEIGIRHIGNSNLITNYGFLCLLEDIACIHSNEVGYGVNQVSQTHLSWILLHWKVSIFKRVRFGTKVTVKSWARPSNGISTLRDFEIYDDEGNLICIASSKWVLVNTESTSIARIPEDFNSRYNTEEKSVFNENDISKLKEPNTTSLNFSFKVLRRDIDLNEHMHNLYYLSYAYESLPREIFESNEFNNFEVMYKTGAKLGEIVDCHYVLENNSHYVVMKTDNKLHAIVKFS